jgi:hypothetical protein
MRINKVSQDFFRNCTVPNGAREDFLLLSLPLLQQVTQYGSVLSRSLLQGVLQQCSAQPCHIPLGCVIVISIELADSWKLWLLEHSMLWIRIVVTACTTLLGIRRLNRQRFPGADPATHAANECILHPARQACTLAFHEIAGNKRTYAFVAVRNCCWSGCLQLASNMNAIIATRRYTAMRKCEKTV